MSYCQSCADLVKERDALRAQLAASDELATNRGLQVDELWKDLRRAQIKIERLEAEIVIAKTEGR